MAPASRIPNERTAPAKDLEVRPRHVKAWIESLPLARTLESARSACAHLTGLNAARVDLDDRVQILEMYRPVVAVLLDELGALYGRGVMPLAPKAREALDAARDLASAMAVGYKIAASERASRRISFGAKKQLPLLLARPLEFLAAGQRAAYRSYTPVPPGVWSDMHRIFLHAEAEGVAAEPVDGDAASSVAGIYCESLLLALTDPYRLVQGELDKALAQIRAARAPVTLSNVRPHTRPGGHFIVPCDTDKPPKPALSANDDTGGPNWRLLDANPLVERLRMKKQAIDSGQVSATMSRSVTPDVLALMGRLIVLWGDPPRRSSRRDPCEASVAVCVGIRALGHYASLEPRLSPQAEAKALRKGITMPLAPLPVDDGAEPVPVFEWDIVNRSAGGLKVRRLAPAQPVAIGDVVGLKLEDERGWTVGAVRWITIFDEGGMEFGVQFLGKAQRMVWVQPTIGASAQSKPGLLVSDPDEPEAPEALLAPANTHSELRELELRDDKGTMVVRAAALVERTGRFELFQLSRA